MNLLKYEKDATTMTNDNHFRDKSPSEIATYRQMTRESQGFFLWGVLVALIVGFMLFAFAWFTVWANAGV